MLNSTPLQIQEKYFHMIEQIETDKVDHRVDHAIFPSPTIFSP